VRLVRAKSVYTRAGDIVLYAAIAVIAAALGLVLLKD
jgi:hypothetical protein